MCFDHGIHSSDHAVASEHLRLASSAELTTQLIYTVFPAALLTAFATGLGALPFLFIRNMSRHHLAVCNAVAAGLMLAATATMAYEASHISIQRMCVGCAVGFVFIGVSFHLIEGNSDVQIGSMKGRDAMKSLIIVCVMTIHSAAEGIGVGVSYAGSDGLGIFITTAIAIHNIPEGLAISLVLVPRGSSVLAASWWSIFSSLPQPLMAVPAFLFVCSFSALLPLGLGVAAGAMLYMTLFELVPEAIRDCSSKRVVASVIVISCFGMLLFQELLRWGGCGLAGDCRPTHGGSSHLISFPLAPELNDCHSAPSPPPPSPVLREL